MATIEEQALKNALDGDNEALAETLDKLMPGELRALALAARDLALCAARKFPTEQTPNAGVQRHE